MAAKSHYLDNALLSGVLRNVAYTPAATVYAALFTVIPTPATAGTEAADANYARVAVTFGAPALGVCSNTGILSFYGAGAAVGETVVAVGIKDALAAGNLLYFGALSVSKVVGVGDTLSFAIGALSVTEQ